MGTEHSTCEDNASSWIVGFVISMEALRGIPTQVNINKQHNKQQEHIEYWKVDLVSQHWWVRDLEWLTLYTLQETA